MDGGKVDVLKNRANTYHKLATKFSYLSEANLKQFLYNSNEKSKGVGKNYVFEIENVKVFAKSLKVTQKEYDNMFDTSNLFNLPTFYNYGIGSYGINVWRELLMHIKTTQFVLNNECVNFPLLYHYRIIKEKKEHTVKYNDYYIKYWNSDKNIKKYLDEKNKTVYRLILLLEYFPYASYERIPKTRDIKSFYSQAYNIINFLNKRNILHFDAHLGNFLVDKNDVIYLTDYGLVIDKEFYLSRDEIKFFDQNEKYDRNMICYSTINAIFDVIVRKENIKKCQKKFDFEWNKNTKDNVILNVIKNNNSALLDYLKIKYDKKILRKLLKHGFSFKKFINKLRSDKTKTGTLATWK